MSFVYLWEDSNYQRHPHQFTKKSSILHSTYSHPCRNIFNDVVVVSVVVCYVLYPVSGNNDTTTKASFTAPTAASTSSCLFNAGEGVLNSCGISILLLVVVTRQVFPLEIVARIMTIVRLRYHHLRHLRLRRDFLLVSRKIQTLKFPQQSINEIRVQLKWRQRLGFRLELGWMIVTVEPERLRTNPPPFPRSCVIEHL